MHLPVIYMHICAFLCGKEEGMGMGVEANTVRRGVWNRSGRSKGTCVNSYTSLFWAVECSH